MTKLAESICPTFSRALVLALLGFLALIVIPPTCFVRTGPSKISLVGDNLTLLSGAKQQWALEHKKNGAVPVTREDLTPYFSHTGMTGYIVPVDGERYVIGNLNQALEAVLTRSMEKYPKGTIMRLGTNRYIEIIPPTAP